MKIALVAGEASGDLLGAGLIQALKTYFPDATFEGVAGPLMQAAGCRSLFDMERLAVMGFVEPLKRLPELFAMRKQLIKRFTQHKPDVFIGIDAPAFNTGLEGKLKAAGIKTVHYVSPSVWAWRQNRIHAIKKSVDLMLTLLPFENNIYDDHGIPNVFVGHPLADELPLETDTLAARTQLQLPLHTQTIALLPGSRQSELKQLTQVFLEAATCCYDNNPNLQFIAPMVSEDKQQQFQAAAQHLAPDLPLTVFKGHSRTVMAAADVVLLASGTATLEAMLLGKPMVVAYKLHPITHWLAKRLVKVHNVALPNLLANKRLVPEFIQEAVTPEALSNAVLMYLNHPNQTLTLQQDFKQIHQQLKQNANQTAAGAIAKLLKET